MNWGRIAVIAAAFLAGAAAVWGYREPQVRAALARADSLAVRLDSLKGVSDSLERVVGKTDTLRLTRWTAARAAEKLAPPVCAPIIAKVELAVQTDSVEIADLRKENAVLRAEVATDDSANTALRKAAKNATRGITLFRVFGLPVKLAPNLSLGSALDAPLRPKVFLSVVSIGL